MDRWGGAPAIKLMAIGRNLANRVTTDRKGKPVNGPHPGYFAVTWRGNMWANVNRSGHGNEFHSHPGAFWSGVYYVDDGGIDADPSLGGELEFMDPRGPMPAMNAPHLGYAMPGGLTAGATERDPAQGRPAGDVPVLDDPPGAALSGHGRAHLHRVQSQSVTERGPPARSCSVARSCRARGRSGPEARAPVKQTPCGCGPSRRAPVPGPGTSWMVNWV